MANYHFTASSASKLPVGAICFLNEIKVALNNQGIKWEESTRHGIYAFDIIDAPKDICSKFATVIDTCMEVVYEVTNTSMN